MSDFLESLGPHRSLIWLAMIVGPMSAITKDPLIIMGAGVGLICGFLLGLRVASSQEEAK